MPRRRRDPIEVLRELDPAHEMPLPQPDPAALARIKAQPLSEPQRPRRPWFLRPRVLYPVLVTAVAACAAAGAYVLVKADSDPTGFACYARVDLYSPRVGHQNAPGIDRFALCREDWLAQVVPNPGGPPPPMQACVLPSGIVGIFPADEGDPCRELGIPRWAGATITDEKIAELTARLSDKGAQGTCISRYEAVAFVETLLRELDLPDWRVDQAGLPASVRCVSFVAPDAVNKVVSLSPDPRNP